MTRDDILQYFERYIFNYLPYRDTDLYKVIMRYLIDVYLEEGYFKIPSEVSLYLNNEEVSPEILDKLLVNVGLPYDVLKNLSYSTKVLIFKLFGDLARIKGTFEIAYRIVKDLNEPYALYELWLDRYNDDWYFIPKLIYKSDAIEGDPDPIPFDTVYNSVPELLYSKEQLDALYTNGSILLPIRCHILYFYTPGLDIGAISTLIYVMFYAAFKTHPIQITISGITFSGTLQDVVLATYYLLAKASNNKISVPSYIAYVYHTDEIAVRRIPDDFDELLQDYSRIMNTKDAKTRSSLLQEFYYKWYEPYKSRMVESTITSDEIFTILRTNNENLANYLLNNVVPFLDTKLNEVLDDLMNSIISTIGTYETFDRFKYLFASLLFGRSINLERTSGYRLLAHFKPYHVTLMSITGDTYIIRDPFNFVNVYDEQPYFDILTKYVGVLYAYDESTTHYKRIDSYTIEIKDPFRTLILVIELSELDIVDRFLASKILTLYSSVLQLLSTRCPSLAVFRPDYLYITSVSKVWGSPPKFYIDLRLEDKPILLTTRDNVSVFKTLDHYITYAIDPHFNHLYLITSCLARRMFFTETNYLQVNEKYMTHLVQNTPVSIFSSKDSVNEYMKITVNDYLFLADAYTTAT